MTGIKFVVCAVLLLGSVLPMLPQSSAATANNTVPPLISFSGTLTDINLKPLTGVVGVMFYLYKGQDGGAPL